MIGNTKYKLKCMLYDTKNKLKELWVNFIRPNVPKTYKELGFNTESFITLHRITAEPPGYYELASVYDTSFDLITVKSWLIPWKKFYYIDLYREEAVNSNYYILHSIPKNSGYKTVGDFEKDVREYHNKSLNNILLKEINWYAPARFAEGITVVNTNYNVNIGKLLP